MMKRTLLLLSLLAVPCVLTSCKDDNTAAQNTSTSSVSPLDKLCSYLKLWGYTEKRIKIFCAGYTGDTATLDKLKNSIHIDIYCTGAAAAGNKELVLKCLDKGADPNEGLFGAALGGQKELALLMFDKADQPGMKGASPTGGLKGAAAGGHMDIVQLMLDKGANPNAGLKGAAAGGHMDIVQLLLDKGATDYYLGLKGAAAGGHMDIVQLMLEKGAHPNYGLEGAAAGGHMEIVKLLLEKGATNLDSALNAARLNGHTKCAKLILAAMEK